jgi:hypothetical protein
VLRKSHVSSFLGIRNIEVDLLLGGVLVDCVAVLVVVVLVESVVVVGLRSAKLQLLGLALRELGVSFAQVLQQGEGVEEEGEEEEERRTQGRY